MRIQETAQNESTTTWEEPPGLAHSPPGGRNQFYMNEHVYDQESMPQKQNRTDWAVLFYMVAELAIELTIWSVELAI
eukprot:2441121-Amphidinium_carterae.1